MSRMQGAGAPGVPAFVGLSPKMGHGPWANPGLPGFLGPAHAPFQPNGGGSADLVLNNITLDRLQDRGALLHSFDSLRRDVDASGLPYVADTSRSRRVPPGAKSANAGAGGRQ